MNNLVRHIEYLLLDNDRVAVPGLGTFVSTRMPLHIDDSGMFCVPRRDVSLVPMVHDDGLLVSCISREHRCTKGESRDIISRWTEECRLTAHECGTCDLGNLGQLVVEDGTMQLRPSMAGITIPQYFGLDNLDMPVLPLLTTQIKEAVDRAEDQGRGHIVIRLNRSMVHYVASIAAAIVMFLAFTTPTAHRPASYEASLAPGFFVPTAHSHSEDSIMLAAEHEAEAETEAEAEDPEPAYAQGYAVVVASRIKRANAEAMIERLNKNGIDGAQLFERDGMLRVAFMGYSSREAANAAAAHLRTIDKELSGAWVLEVE